MNKHSDFLKRAGIVLLMSFSTSVVFAGSIASEYVDTGGLSLSPIVAYDSASLRVSSDDLDATSSYAAGESISVNSGNLADGIYSYELTLSTDPSVDSPNGNSVSQNGGFKVAQGVASSNSDEEQEAEAQAAAVAATQINEGAPQ